VARLLAPDVPPPVDEAAAPPDSRGGVNPAAGVGLRPTDAAVAAVDSAIGE